MKYRILGTGGEAISMIFEILSQKHKYDSEECHVEIVPNVKDYKIEYAIDTPGVYYDIVDPKNVDWTDGTKMVFGAMGSIQQVSKPRIFEWFFTNYQIGKLDYDNVIHPNSEIASTTKMATGVHIEPGVILATYTTIDFGVSINRGATIGHHTHIGEFTTINPGTTIASSVKIGKHVIIGAGAIVIEHVTIGDHAIIGAGSLVLKDVPENAVIYGNPARIVRYTNHTEP